MYLSEVEETVTVRNHDDIELLVELYDERDFSLAYFKQGRIFMCGELRNDLSERLEVEGEFEVTVPPKYSPY